MSKYQVEFAGYLYPDEYDTEEEAIDAADEMASSASLGAELLAQSNPGDAEEENAGFSTEYYIVEIDEYGNEIDRFQP